MDNTLERIQIEGLHGYQRFDVRLANSTLILVGENGSGKTTFLRILFGVLSGRLSTLIPFRFDHIAITVGGIEYKITHKDITAAFKAIDRAFLSDVPPTLRRRILEVLESGGLEGLSTLEIEPSVHRYGYSIERLLRQIELRELAPDGPMRKQQEKVQAIQKLIKAQILYLPTYRRIERELSSIFEGLDHDDLRRTRERLRQRDLDDVYVELVEFGMRDVQEAVDRELVSLKEFARESLNDLTLKYLGDVVNQEYQNVGMKEIADVADDTVRAVLDRIQESILTQNHKEHLYGVINSARSADEPTEHEKIIYHYFLKLLRFQESLHQRERQISDFCALCSQYILDKRFVYNSTTFSFDIVSENFRSGRQIGLSDLSSGEKQIVSLFSHLYLSGHQRFFVLIDEPELSLSVPWQRRFLTDIRNGAFCAGLIAVTHSPFIYDNELRSYAHALGEFIGR